MKSLKYDSRPKVFGILQIYHYKILIWYSVFYLWGLSLDESCKMPQSQAPQILILQLHSTQQLLCMYLSPMLVNCLIYVSNCWYFPRHISHYTTELFLRSTFDIYIITAAEGLLWLLHTSKWPYSTSAIKLDQASL